jgi:hypothetical protein
MLVNLTTCLVRTQQFDIMNRTRRLSMPFLFLFMACRPARLRAALPAFNDHLFIMLRRTTINTHMTFHIFSHFGAPILCEIDFERPTVALH